MKSKKEKTQTVSEYVQELIDKSNAIAENSTDDSLKYALEALELSIKHKLPNLTAISHNRLGSYHWISGNYDDAISHFGKAFSISDEINETHIMTQAFLGFGNVYSTIGIMDQSITYYNKALSIAENDNSTDMIAKILNNLGTLYEDLKDYNRALDYYQQCLHTAIEIEDKYSENIVKINLSNTHLAMKNFDQSMEFISEAIEYGKTANKSLFLAHGYHSLGSLYQKKEEYDESIQFFLLGVEKALECKDMYILFRLNVELGNSYNLLNNFEDAQNFYKRALSGAEDIGMDELMPRIYEAMARFYEKYEMKEETLHFYKKYLDSNKELEEKRRKERLKSIAFQSKLSVSLEETKVYQELTKELRQSYESLHVLSKIGQSMTASLDLNDILNQLYNNVNLLMNAEGLYVGLFNKKTSKLQFNWNFENGTKLDSFELALDDKNSWMVWSFVNKKTIKINDIEQEYKKYIECRTEPSGILMHSAMYSPLIIEGEVIGVFSIQSKEKDAYTESHNDLMQTLSSYLAIAVKNAAKTKELAKLNKRLKTKSEHDGLTGISNRRLFDETYEVEWLNSLEKESALSVLIIDIDNFKEFNDQYGHLIGDEVVKSVAQILAVQQRNEDDFVARYGGDEFVAILPHTTKEEATVFGEKFSASLQHINTTLNIDIEVTVSIGIATTIPNKMQSKKNLIYTADNQLYLSKANGKNQISAIHLK